MGGCSSAHVQSALACMGETVRIDETIDAIELYYAQG